MSVDAFDLERYTPYLINRLGSRIVAAFERELAPRRFTIKTWRILASTWHYGELSQRELSRQTSIDPSTLSRLVASLVRRGLLTTRRDANDSRAVQVRLTAKGREATEELIPKALAYERRSQAGLSSADVLKLHEVLRRMYENLDGADGGGAPEDPLRPGLRPDEPRPAPRNGRATRTS